MEDRAVLTPKEAAQLIGCTSRGVTKWLAAGELEGCKIGSRWFVNKAALYRRLGIEEEGSR